MIDAIALLERINTEAQNQRYNGGDMMTYGEADPLLLDTRDFIVQLIDEIDNRIAELEKADTVELSASNRIAELKKLRRAMTDNRETGNNRIRLCKQCKTPEGEPHPYRHRAIYEHP